MFKLQTIKHYLLADFVERVGRGKGPPWSLCSSVSGTTELALRLTQTKEQKLKAEAKTLTFEITGKIFKGILAVGPLIALMQT